MIKKYLLFILLSLSIYQINAQTNFYKPFSSINTNRNGSFCFYNSLQTIFNNTVDTTTIGIRNLELNQDVNTGLIIINKEIKFSYDERVSLLKYVGKGNIAFISGVQFEEPLTNLLNFTVPPYTFERLMDSTNMLIDNDAITPFKNKNSYTMHSDLINNKISNIPYNGKVLGRNNKYETNFIKLTYGKGLFFIQTAPFSFCNEFLLKDENYNFVETITSHMPKDLSKIYFDEHIYNYSNNVTSITNSNSSSSSNSSGGKNGSKSEGEGEEKPPSQLEYILNDPNLRPALFLSLLAILLSVLFAVLRKQRPINVIPPVKNNSKELVDSISDVYLNQHDNKVIAEKKIKFFNETIRTKYGIQTNEYNVEFWEKLQAKTSMKDIEIKNLKDSITHCNNNLNINNAQLINLSNKLDVFYKIK